MKQILDTFGCWGFFALYTVLLLAAAFLIGFEMGCPIDRNALFSSDEKSESLSKYHGLEELSLADLVRVKDTLEMWFKMNIIAGRYVVNGKRLPAAETLRRGKAYCRAFSDAIVSGNTINILAGEIEVRRIICETIDAIPGFRDSERFKELIERYPTYKEKKQ